MSRWVPVGQSDICARLGVSRATVERWRLDARCGFPPLVCEVGGRPVWDWADVQAWAAGRHGGAVQATNGTTATKPVAAPAPSKPVRVEKKLERTQVEPAFKGAAKR